MFAADAFAPGLTIWQQLGGFLMHLIPSFILLALLIVAWKWEYIGGIIFTVIGLGLSPFIFMHNYNMNHSVGMSLGIILMITFPLVVVGILFIISHFMKKKNLLKTHNE
jgi:cytochrome b561